MTNPQRILLLPMCGLGDAVCYLPFVEALRARFPQAEIVAVVATAPAGVILQRSPANIQVIVFNRGDRQRGWWPLLRLLWTMRRRKFDVAISGAHPDSVRVPLFAFLTGAKVRVGGSSEPRSFLYSHRVEIRANAHYFERYRLLLTALDIYISQEEYLPTLQPPPEARESAARIWNQAGLDGAKPVVGMVSGADVNWRGPWKPYLKRWTNAGYAEVARWVTNEMSGQVVMFGGLDESGFASEIASLSGVPVVNLCGKTGLGELQWLISKCTAFISNDTGIMHIAGALGIQMVALFGPTSPNSFRPPGKGHRVVQGHALCSPCYPRPSCDLKECRAMADISPRQVIEDISLSLESATLIKRRVAVSPGCCSSIGGRPNYLNEV